jgi:hypothetical protein
MRVRSELSKLHQGLGLFKIVGGGFGTGLYFDGQPISFYWDDCRGSVAQYLAQAKILDTKENLTLIRNFVEGQVAAKHSLAEQVEPLLQLFETGEYALNLLDVEGVLPMWDEYPGKALEADFQEDIGNFYPLGTELITTRPKRSLNQERVKVYESDLKKRQRPIVITTSVKDGWAEFVIDGHHKLQAYQNLKIAPRVLQIVKQVESFVTEEDIEAFLSTYPNAAKHYRRHNY